jgi:hypothetical protein
MRAEAASWDDWATSHAPPTPEEDKWHVALAPGEVKVVSLEQLDDLFRLSIVDAETKVWQNGMSAWQPLGVIAGIDDAGEAKRAHPKPPAPRSAPPPPRPAPAANSARPAAPVYAEPLQPSRVYAEPRLLAPVRSVAPVTSLAPVASVRPLTVTRPPRSASKGGGFGRFLVGSALLAGVSITLYRNGVVHDAARAMHREALYGRLEAALGGPSFGTLLAVEQSSIAKSPSSGSQPDATTDLAPSPVASTPTAAAPPVVSIESITPEKVHSASPEPTAAPLPSPPPPAAKAVSHSSASSRSAPEAAATPKHTAEKTTATKAPEKPASQMTDRERLNAAISQTMQSPVKGHAAKHGASEYDPLNPNL